MTFICPHCNEGIEHVHYWFTNGGTVYLPADDWEDDGDLSIDEADYTYKCEECYHEIEPRIVSTWLNQARDEIREANPTPPGFIPTPVKKEKTIYDD